ncbi:hypothetical protein PCL_01135 [Purpureocillium lilacinum]|uniref:Uncharacterized protein n=1 Tax=Purpureocillium lilacinum TaxID=33203 RepID=A0A2U3E4Q6_PURLI|nr:hypothetical protein PCL_01135 [Purpureocillium lilacinum]
MAGQGLALWRSPRRGPASWAWPSTEPDEAGDPGHVATRRYKAGLAWPGWESGTLPCRALACPRQGLGRMRNGVAAGVEEAAPCVVLVKRREVERRQPGAGQGQRERAREGANAVTKSRGRVHGRTCDLCEYIGMGLTRASQCQRSAAQARPDQARPGGAGASAGADAGAGGVVGGFGARPGRRSGDDERCPVPAPVRTPHKTWRRNTIGAREESEETEGTRGPGWFPFPSTCLRCGQERQKRQELARHWAAGIREGAARWAGLGWARWAGLGTSWPMGTSWAGSRGWHDELAGAGRVSHGDGREGGRDSHGCMARAREGGRHGLLDLRHGVASCNATQRNATQHQAAGLDPACHGCPSPASAKTTNRCTRDLAHAQSRIDIRGLGVTIAREPSQASPRLFSGLSIDDAVPGASRFAWGRFVPHPAHGAGSQLMRQIAGSYRLARDPRLAPPGAPSPLVVCSTSKPVGSTRRSNERRLLACASPTAQHCHVPFTRVSSMYMHPRARSANQERLIHSHQRLTSADATNNSHDNTPRSAGSRPHASAPAVPGLVDEQRHDAPVPPQQSKNSPYGRGTAKCEPSLTTANTMISSQAVWSYQRCHLQRTKIDQGISSQGAVSHLSVAGRPFTGSHSINSPAGELSWRRFGGLPLGGSGAASLRDSSRDRVVDQPVLQDDTRLHTPSEARARWDGALVVPATPKPERHRCHCHGREDDELEPQEPIIPGATKCDSAAMSLPKPVAGPCILPHGAACIVQRGDRTSMSLSLMPWRSHPHGVPPANQAGGPSATSKSFVPLAALELDRSPPLALLRLTVRHGKWARIDGQGSRRVGFSLLVGARVHVARRGHFSAKQSAPAKQTTYY